FEKDHSRIGADAEEGGGAEVHVAGIAAEDVPRGGEHHELQHDEAGEEDVLVDAAQRGAEREDEQHGGPDPEFHRPNNPCGRMPSTTSSRPKATAGAHEAPSIISTIDSTTPRISPAASVPVMLPRPARTTTQKVRPM